MKRLIIVTIAAFLVLGLLFGSLIVLGGARQSQVSACQPAGAQFDPVDTVTGTTPTFTEPEQIYHAKLIIGIGLARKLSLRDIKIALMVAMQESWLKNLLVATDHDSLGLFQQRPSVLVWGTAEQIIDPKHATNKFYEALEKVPNRNSRTLFDVATDVQRPNEVLYARTFDSHGPAADAFLVGVEAGTDPPAEVSPPGEGCSSLHASVETAVQAALSQSGKPYRWEQTDGKLFDSGELMQWAYAQAGVTLPLTAADQLEAGPKVPKPDSDTQVGWTKVLVRGDLLYWSDPLKKIAHVTMYLGDNQHINVPLEDANVGVSTINWSDPLRKLSGAVRPIDTANDEYLLPGEWQWPVKDTFINSPYGMRFHPYLLIWRLHAGVDFRAGWNTPVYAPHDARVSSIRVEREGGNILVLNHGGGVETMYLHLANTNGMRVGQQVKKGQLVAYTGNTGCCSTGPHLHYVVMLNGRTTDPIAYMRQYGLVP